MGSRSSKKHPFFLFTIGHSTRPIDEFLALLKENHVSLLVDVRTIPKSRHNPQYWGTTLEVSLSEVGIGYQHISELGGLRKPQKDSHNTGWRNRSFHGYADYMETKEFEAALKELIGLAKAEIVVIMCAEAVPWRCHRNLIADVLTVRGYKIGHIMGIGKVTEHKITSWATVRGKHLIYAPLPEAIV